jgi:hypothetical protein
MAEDDNLTALFCTSAVGIVVLIINSFVLGPVVDYFMDFGMDLQILNLSLRSCMATIMYFGSTFYWFIDLIAALLVISPIIVIIKRHRYMSASVEQSTTQNVDQELY